MIFSAMTPAPLCHSQASRVVLWARRNKKPPDKSISLTHDPGRMGGSRSIDVTRTYNTYINYRLRAKCQWTRIDGKRHETDFELLQVARGGGG